MFFKKSNETTQPKQQETVRTERSFVDACKVQPADSNPFSLEKVIFDQGHGGFSIALGEWDYSKRAFKPMNCASNRILAMRWNGTNETEPGYPAIGPKGENARLNAQWFPLPGELNESILNFVAKHNLDYLLEKHALRDLCSDR